MLSFLGVQRYSFFVTFESMRTQTNCIRQKFGFMPKPELLYIYTVHIRLSARNGGVYRISYQFVCSIAAELLTLYSRFRETV